MYAFSHGQELTLNAFKIGIFPLKPTQEKGIKIVTPKQILYRLPIAPAQVNLGNTSENLLNEIQLIIYSYTEQKKLLKKYITYNEFKKNVIRNGYYIYELQHLVLIDYYSILQKKQI